MIALIAFVVGMVILSLIFTADVFFAAPGPTPEHYSGQVGSEPSEPLDLEHIEPFG